MSPTRRRLLTATSAVLTVLTASGRGYAGLCMLPAAAIPDGAHLAPNVVRLIRVAQEPERTGQRLNATVVEKRGGNPAWGLERTCGVAHPKPLSSSGRDCTSAANLIKPDGRIEYRRDNAPGSFCLETAAWRGYVIARVALTTDSDDEAYCGPIEPGKTYRYPDQHDNTRGASAANPIVSVRLWAQLSETEAESPRQQARAAAADLRDKYLKEWFFRRWAATVYDHTNVDGKGLIELLDAAIGQAKAEIENGTGAFSDLARLAAIREPIDRAPLVAAVTAAAQDVARSLPRADPETLCAYASDFATPQGDTAPPAVLRANLEIVGDGSEVASVALAVGLAYQDGPGAPALPWPVFAGNLPATARGFSRTIELSPGSGRGVEQENVAVSDEHVLVFAHDLARDRIAAGSTIKGDTVAFIRGDAVALKANDLGTAVASLVRSVVAVGAIGDARNFAPACPAEARALCDDFDKQFESLRPSDLPPLPSGWQAPFTSVVLAPDVIEPARHYVALVCRGVDTCDTSVTSSAVMTSVAFSSAPAHAFVSTVTEVAGNWPWTGAPVNGWRFDPVVGTSEPSQLFRLGRHDEWADRMTTSQLLVLYPWHASHRQGLQGLGLGFGPTLFEGTDAKLWGQWNGRILYETPYARGVVISLGVSARRVAVPHGVPEGALLVGSMGQPPSLSYDKREVWLLSAGLGIDLSILGDAWSAAGKAFSTDKGSAQ